MLEASQRERVKESMAHTQYGYCVGEWVSSACVVIVSKFSHTSADQKEEQLWLTRAPADGVHYTS